jgi:hypothetical protein
VLDLDYAEIGAERTPPRPSPAGPVEVQATAEGAPFSEAEFGELLALARGHVPAHASAEGGAEAVIRLAAGDGLVVASHNPGKVREIKS